MTDYERLMAIAARPPHSCAVPESGYAFERHQCECGKWWQYRLDLKWHAFIPAPPERSGHGTGLAHDAQGAHEPTDRRLSEALDRTAQLRRNRLPYA